MDIKEKINTRIEQVQKEITEKEEKLSKWADDIEEGCLDDEGVTDYDYYDGYKDGLYKELNDLRALL